MPPSAPPFTKEGNESALKFELSNEEEPLGEEPLVEEPLVPTWVESE
jgi:hypothetical protein